MLWERVGKGDERPLDEDDVEWATERQGRGWSGVGEGWDRSGREVGDRWGSLVKQSQGEAERGLGREWDE